MIIIGFVIAIFFIIMICLICRGYLEDIIELENRVLQLEKRISVCEKENVSVLFENRNNLKCILVGDILYERKDGEKEMACKKGRGGKRK